jgi:hypothetical protein
VYEHVVLATQTYSPLDFAAQITLSQGNMWGMMRLFIKLFEDQPEGKVSVLLRLHLSSVAFFNFLNFAVFVVAPVYHHEGP